MIRFDDEGPVSLPKMLFQRGRARATDQVRWPNEDDGVIQYGEGTDHLNGGDVGDDLAPTPEEGGSDAPRIAMDRSVIDRGDEGVMTGGLASAVQEMASDPNSKHVLYSRIWPVPGDGIPAVRGQVGANGLVFSDGRYAPNGGYRVQKGKSGAHYGIDLPGQVGTKVAAADDGTILSHGNAKGWGNYVAVEHVDGNVSLYAHLDKDEAPAVGTRVAQGEGVGHVGISGNAAGHGSHLHYEIRRKLPGRTLASASRANGGVTVDPTSWTNNKVEGGR